MAKLADFLVAEGVVDDISHEGLRALLHQEGVSFQVIKTWKQSNDPDFEAKKNRILHLYGLIDGTDDVLDGDPDVVICVDEFGPFKLQPHPGRLWATRGGGGSPPRRRRRATYTRPHGVRHLLAAYHLSRDRCRDRLYGHIKPRKRRTEFLVFPRYLRTSPAGDAIGHRAGQLQPAPVDPRVTEWAAANNAELAYTPTNASWLNRIEAQFQALRCFTLDGTDHASHAEQASMIRRYIAWRNRNAHDHPFREIIDRVKVA